MARRLDGEARELCRTSSQALQMAAAQAGRNDTAAMLGYLVALVTAIAAARRWHEAQEHRAQAEAAGRAGRLLREAVEVTAGAVAAGEFRARPRRAGAARPSTSRAPAVAAGGRDGGQRLMTAVVQHAIPAHARAVLADPAWPVLRGRLLAVEEGGEDPGEVLAAVAARRELGSAESVAEVLTWRLDGWSRTRGAAAGGPVKAATSSGAGGAAAPAAARRRSPAPGPQRPGGGQQQKGPRRAR
jgi:hypothetical protein